MIAKYLKIPFLFPNFLKYIIEKGKIKKIASYLTNTANDIHTKQAIREKFVFFKKSANDVTNKKRNNE